MKRMLGEFALTLAVLGTLALYEQLRDPTSRLRCRVDETRERASAWWSTYRDIRHLHTTEGREQT